MHRVSTPLKYLHEFELANEVRKRTLNSLYMRHAAGKTRHLKAFGYPHRGAAKLCGPRVNKAAKSYWVGPSNDPKGHYYFSLSPLGLIDAYEAVQRLFKDQPKACDRTLIHCDYLLSMIHFKVFSETLGKTTFNHKVLTGDINLVLKWNGFTDITQYGPGANLSKKSLQAVKVSSENDFIIGDHVVCYNHQSYDSLNTIGDPWRLENAFVVDKIRNKHRYQGHGYYSPVYKERFIRSMMGWYNRKIYQAWRFIRSGNLSKLHSKYPNVIKEKGQWKLRYQKLGGDCPDKSYYKRPLRALRKSDYPNPFASPCNGEIWVRRPLESK